MDTPLVLSADTLNTAGILLLTVLAIEFGGFTVLRMVRGSHPVTEFQKSFARAGHAHAGVLVIFALVIQVYADAAAMEGVLGFFARSGVWIAAILMSAGFFLSSAGRDATRPNVLIWLVYVGALSLAVGVASLGVGLLTA